MHVAVCVFTCPAVHVRFLDSCELVILHAVILQFMCIFLDSGELVILHAVIRMLVFTIACSGAGA